MRQGKDDLLAYDLFILLLSVDTYPYYRACICRPFRSPGIDSQHGGPVRQPYLSYWPARLHRLAKSIPGFHKVLQIRAQVTIKTSERVKTPMGEEELVPIYCFDKDQKR